LGRLLDVVRRSAYREVHVAYNTIGEQRGLPVDVATVQIGKPGNGLWWNLRRGVVPEQGVRTEARTVTDNESLNIVEKYGMSPIGQMFAQGIAQHADGKRIVNERAFQKRVPSKLVYDGWRDALRSMLENRAIRGSAEAERLLGRRQYQRALTKRRLRETVHYDAGW